MYVESFTFTWTDGPCVGCVRGSCPCTGFFTRMTFAATLLCFSDGRWEFGEPLVDSGRGRYLLRCGHFCLPSNREAVAAPVRKTSEANQLHILYQMCVASYGARPRDEPGRDGHSPL